MQVTHITYSKEKRTTYEKRETFTATAVLRGDENIEDAFKELSEIVNGAVDKKVVWKEGNADPFEKPEPVNNKDGH